MRKIALTLGLVGIVNAAQGQLVTVGDEFQINTYSTVQRDQTDAAMDREGNFVVVWSAGPYGKTDIRGQRFGSDGSRHGDELQINTYISGHQTAPAVAIDRDGDGFLVVWQDQSRDGAAESIRGQRFSSNGVPLGDEFQVNSYTTGPQRGPAVTLDAAGNSVVVWEGQGEDGFLGGIYGQRLDPQGAQLGGQFQVNVHTGGHSSYARPQPKVAADAGGDFVVAWDTRSQDGYPVIYARRYRSDGNALSGEFQVNDPNFFPNFRPSVAMAPSGEFVIAWYYSQAGIYAYGVQGARFDADGNRIGNEIVIQTQTLVRKEEPEVAMADDGGFVVVWPTYEFYPIELDLEGQRFASDGSPVGQRFQVNTEAFYHQRNHSVAMDGGDRFVVAWVSDFQNSPWHAVRGQRYAEGLVFEDGFESGDISAWSEAHP